MNLKTIGLSALALGAVLIGCNTQKEANNDLSERGLTGKVKTLVEEFYYYPHDFDDNDKLIDTASATLAIMDSILFDEAGYILSNYSTSDEEPVEGDQGHESDSLIYHFQTDYKRNPESKLLKKTKSYNGQVYEENRYDYNEKGWLIQDALYIDSTLLHKTRYVHNEKGQVIKERSFSELDSLISEQLYEYNDKGLCIEMKRRFKGSDKDKEHFDYIKRYVYDDKGNNTEEHLQDNESGKFYVAIRTTYDNKKNVTQVLSMDPKGEVFSERRFRYDEHGNTIEDAYTEKVVGSTDYSDRETYEYTYDKQGNWVTCITFVWRDGSKYPINLRKRRITYY